MKYLVVYRCALLCCSIVEGFNDADDILNTLSMSTAFTNESEGGSFVPVWPNDVNVALSSGSKVITFSDEEEDFVAVTTSATNSSLHSTRKEHSNSGTWKREEHQNIYLKAIKHEEELHNSYFTKWLKVRGSWNTNIDI